MPCAQASASSSVSRSGWYMSLNIFFAMPSANVGPFARLAHLLPRARVELVVGHYRVHERQRKRFGRIHPPAGVCELLGAQDSEVLRQEVHGAAVGHETHVAEHHARTSPSRRR